MKRKIGRILVLLLTAMILAVTVEANEISWPVNPDDKKWNFEKAREWSDFANINEDSAELVIGLTKGKDDTCTRLSHLITENGGKVVKTISTKKEILAIVAEIPFDTIPDVVLKVKATGLAKYIEPNLRVQLEFIPNDPYWPYKEDPYQSGQWGPKKIEADWAWNRTFGSSSVLVAVVDSGINYTHPDLAANYVALGYDWANNDSDPMDDNGHGTSVAGIVAAVINNGVGIAGLAQVKVMAEKVFHYGSGDASWVAEGIIHATDQGARVISMSLSTPENATVLYEAVKYAYEENVLLVAAAGNYANETKRYPAAYDEVIAVSATDRSDYPTDFSNYGDWIELAAPGIGIFTTVNWNYPNYGYYSYFSGTSAACPHVSGLAALLWSAFPDATRDWIRTRLRDTADDLGTPGFDIHYGYGRINARKAIYGTSPAINYTLAITSTAGGTTDPLPGNYTYLEGQDVPVQAMPDIGYGLDHWKLDGVNVGSANPYSVLMDNNYTLQAVFAFRYTLTITTATDGTTNPSPGFYLYNNGTSVSVNATPDIGYVLDHWKLDGINVGSANPYSVLMDNNHTLQAVFAQITYTLVITTTMNGTTNPEPGSYNYTAETIVNVTAIPDANCYLHHWELDNVTVGTANSISVTMNTNHTLQAVFAADIHDVAIVSAEPSVYVALSGEEINITIVIKNNGTVTNEEINVSVYWGQLWIENNTITDLSPGANKTWTIYWTIPSETEGQARLWANATIQQMDSLPENNMFESERLYIISAESSTGGGGSRMPLMC